MHSDVLIIGGGPAATTLGTLLKLYKPELTVTIIEREKFPRDHIGESQLPAVTEILGEMGVWDKVEAEDFPIKVGTAYRWGITDEVWNLDFLSKPLPAHERPAKLEGIRRRVAFLVDRSKYDQILLEHAKEVGCVVHEQTKAVTIDTLGDRVRGIDAVKTVGDQEQKLRFTARYYVDGSGASALLRRTMKIPVDYPSRLKNIAIWRYWERDGWDFMHEEAGTRVQILSIDWGWLWCIPISKNRASVGLVTHVDYFKNSGKSTDELYDLAIAAEPRLTELLSKAKREETLFTTKDWSYLADRLCGENWFLIGDACGFADPILSAGLTLAQVSARSAACTILELDRGERSPDWLRDQYNDRQRFNIKQHHKFAEFWYSTNRRFTDLMEYCTEIAQSAGIKLDASSAFLWMNLGGFTAGNIADVRSTSFGLSGFTNITSHIFDQVPTWNVAKNNVFELNVSDSTDEEIAMYDQGRVIPLLAYRRGEKLLPLTPINEMVVQAVHSESDAVCVFERFIAYFRKFIPGFDARRPELNYALEALEGMILDGWVKASVDETRPMMPIQTPRM